jgi:DNA-binding NarL/FixJ family response regulator
MKAMNLESLVISQDAALLGVLRPTLEEMAVDIQVCGDVGPASGLLAKRKFDAVIVDCDDLPGGDGLLKALRDTDSNTRSVAFAVLNGKTTTQGAFRCGANFVLQKPLTPLNATRCFNAALNFMVRERHRYFRHRVEMAVRIVLPNARELTAISTNLSEGGMAIRLSGTLPKDAQGKLQFSLPGSNISLELKGQIAWADATGRAGIRFVEVPQSSQYQLDNWLTERMKKELPGPLREYVLLQ